MVLPLAALKSHLRTQHLLAHNFNLLIDKALWHIKALTSVIYYSPLLAIFISGKIQEDFVQDIALDHMKSIISIFRPKPAAGECCSKCQSMTGTPNGLGTLSGHRGGYYHHGEDKLRRSVAQGCPLCKAIDDWRQRSLSDNEKIRAFPARFTEGLYWGGWSGRDERNPPIVPGHPLWDMKLEVIGFYIAQNGYISDNSNKGSFYFCAASHGKLMLKL